MPDPLTATALASAAITLVTPYLVEAAKAGAKKAGEASAAGVGKLWTRLKARLTSPAATEIVQDLERQPEEPDVQAAARQQIKKALEADAGWQAEIARLVEELGGARTVAQQQMTITGDDNIGSQVAGDHNRVDIRGRGQGT